jgi:hypothetical protein
MTTYSQITGANIQNNVRGILSTLLDILGQAEAEQAKLAEFTDADLEAAGITAPDVQFIRNAMADANGLAVLANTGTDPRNPGPNYNYTASWKLLLGP